MEKNLRILTKEIIVVGICFIVLIGTWVLYDNAVYFGLFTKEAGAATATLSVTVTESFTFNITSGATVTFGAVGDGVKHSGHETTFSIDTNSSDGWSVTAGRDRDASTLVSDGDTTIFIDDTGSTGPDPASDVPTCTAGLWPIAGTSKGLGFSMFSGTPTSIKDSCWGTGGHTGDQNNEYAAMATSVSPSKMVRNTAFDTTTQLFSVGYLLEFTAAQQGTTYDGEVIYTGTAAP